MTKNNDYVYKVVRTPPMRQVNPPYWVSCTTGNPVRMLACERSNNVPDSVLFYRFHKVTKPKIKNSPIFAFDSVRSASNFVEHVVPVMIIANFVLLECKYAPYSGHTVTAICRTTSPDNVINFWKDIPGPYSLLFVFNYMSVPSGTVLCDWVKPVARAEFIF